VILRDPNINLDITKCDNVNVQRLIPKPIFDAHPTFFFKTVNQGITIDPKKQPEEDCILNEC
jgi:hypothetical protein